MSGGRPKKLPSERRELRRIPVLVTQSEDAALRAAAEAAGEDLGPWVRRVALAAARGSG